MKRKRSNLLATRCTKERGEVREITDNLASTCLGIDHHQGARGPLRVVPIQRATSLHYACMFISGVNDGY